jgi:hypothetical protein
VTFCSISRRISADWRFIVRVSNPKFLSEMSLIFLLSISCGKSFDETQLSSAKSERSVFEGVATHFDGHGYPYGGCGIPEKELN